MYALEVCADALHRKAPEVTLDPEKLSDLVSLVRQAIDAISADDTLPAEIRQHLVHRLREVEGALLYFRASGYAGVEAAMDSLLGTIVRTPESRDSAETTGWWRRLWANLGLATTGVKSIASSVESATAAIEAVQSLQQ